MIRRLLMLCFACFLCGRSLAGWVGVGVDPKSSAAIGSSMEVVSLQENAISHDLSRMLRNYQASEVAAAGIWYQIRLEREAMRDVASLALQEGAYYTYICNLVAGRIMPKVVDVALLCVHYPDRALFWGPFLFKVTQDVKNLCMQFEQLCTNGYLSFKDQVTFLRISDDLLPYFDLSRLGDVDWRGAFDRFVDLGIDLTGDALMYDIDYVLQQGSNIISHGVADANWMSGSDVCQVFDGSDASLQSLVTDGSSFFNTDYFSAVEGILGSRDSLALPRLFQIDEYDISGFLNTLPGSHSPSDSSYYTQRWYIEEEPYEEVVMDYHPYVIPDGDNTAQWTVVGVGNSNTFTITDQAWQLVRPVSENYCGWSSERVEQLNNSDDDYVYTITYTRNGPKVIGVQKVGYYDKTVKIWGAAYDIKVTRRRRAAAVAWEEVYHSSEEDFNVFMTRANGELSRLQEANPLAHYVLKSEQPEYFTVTTEREVTGISNVSFVVYCSGSNVICDGDFSWKENGSQEDCIQDYTMYEYAMTASERGSLSDQLREADEEIERMTVEAVDLREEISNLRSQNSEYYRLKNLASYNEAERYRQLIARNDSILAVLEPLYDAKKSRLDEVVRCREELRIEYCDDDARDRIPWLEDKLTSVYDVRFNDDARWQKLSCDEAVYTRTGTMNGAVNAVTLRCELSMVRRESHNWLIGRYHRAILNIHYELYGDYTTDDVVETIDLPMDMKDSEKAALVNERTAYWKEAYPDCRVEHEFTRYEDPAIEEPEYEAHLLWNGDRLRIARNVVYSLNHIYARLLLVERQLYFGEHILLKAENKLRWALSSRASHNTFGTRMLNYWLSTGRYASMGDTVFVEDRKRRLRQELDSISDVIRNRRSYD